VYYSKIFLATVAWPPTYDEEYFPKAEQKFWFPHLETMNPKERERLVLRKLRAEIKYAYERSPLYHRKWKQVGIKPDRIRSLEGFHKIPFVEKEEIRRDQEQNSPFGSYICVPPDHIFHVHGTSGTTGRPTAFAISRGDWRRIANAHARVMWGFGLRQTDTIMIASHFSLYMGSWGALIGAERLGVKTFPFGAGAPGQTLLAIKWCKELKPTAFYGTPSYALYFSEVAKGQGIDPRRDFNLRIMFFSGEPGASVPSVKTKIEDTFGCICVDTGSTAEMSPWMSNGGCGEEIGMHLWQDMVFTELVDPKSGEVVSYGEEGVPVYTHLERDSQPMIRFWSNDLSMWTDEPCACGRTYPRLPKGVYGRADDVFIVKGENILPSAIQEALESLDGYGGEHRAIITREREMDVLTVQVEYDNRIAKQSNENNRVLEEFRAKAEANIKTACGVSAMVELVPLGSFERTKFKARRVVDERALHEELARLRFK
jgi:phenylacetate-CoA ligase